MNKKLFIFDLDGTLVNTVGGLTYSLNLAFKKNELPKVSIDQTAKAIGNGILITIRRLVPPGTNEETIQKCFRDFREFYKMHYMVETIPYTGMLGTLRALKSREYKLAVATNKLDEIAIEMLNTMFPDIFDMIVGDSPLFPKKPDPAIINHIVASFDVSKEDAVYVGDSEVDVESASNAGVDLILVDYGFHRSNEFLNIDAKHISSPKELLYL